MERTISNEKQKTAQQCSSLEFSCHPSVSHKQYHSKYIHLVATGTVLEFKMIFFFLTYMNLKTFFLLGDKMFGEELPLFPLL